MRTPEGSVILRVTPTDTTLPRGMLKVSQLILEEFGDGIMSAINFKVDIQRREDPAGDRVVITLDGKFLGYNW